VVARADVPAAGYVGERVASSVTLVRDGDVAVVVDPGMVASREAILGPPRDLGVEPDSVTDVVFRHHHPDHTINAALFGRPLTRAARARTSCASRATVLALRPSLVIPGHGAAAFLPSGQTPA
jgi:glyoxylase-like metal-dependent hydrolase (beta-lactamase superfamily II)